MSVYSVMADVPSNVLIHLAHSLAPVTLGSGWRQMEDHVVVCTTVLTCTWLFSDCMYIHLACTCMYIICATDFNQVISFLLECSCKQIHVWSSSMYWHVAIGSHCVVYIIHINAAIDECAEGTNNCEQLCSDTGTAFVCSCTSGFTLDSNQATCTG